MTSKAAKPKLLLVSGIAPWPKTSGGAVRVFETLSHLNERFAIHFVCAVGTDENVSALEKQVMPFCESFATFQMQPKKSLFSFFSRGIPHWLSEWYNPELALICKNVVEKHSIRLVQIETSQLLYLAPLLPETVFTICTAYDVQLVTFWRRLAETKNWLSKGFKLLLLLQIWHYERKLLPQLNLVATVSTVDQRFLQQLYGLESTLVVPNGYQKPVELKNKPHSLFAIGFIGSAAHAPNQTAIEYLIKQLAPKLQVVLGAFELVLAGDTTGLDKKLFEPQKNITITRLGYLENVADFYQRIDVLVAPIFSGSGTRIKILESLAYGIPVVTTLIGAEGLNINPSDASLLLANSPEEFIAHIDKIKATENRTKTVIKPISLTWQAIFRDYSEKLAKYTNKNQTPA